MESYDFSAWATKANVKCSDGRTISPDAFKGNDKKRVPLIYNHDHRDPFNVLGYADLEHREGQGIYMYGSFNETEAGKQAKEIVKHGDIFAVSIYANQLKQDERGYVKHGDIKEVSLVLAGANSEAMIEEVMTHSDLYMDEHSLMLFTCGPDMELTHADCKKEDKEETPKEEDKEPMAESKGKTVQEVYDTLNDEQKQLVDFLVGKAAEDAAGNNTDDEEGGDDMSHSIFDNDEPINVLSHSEISEIFKEGRRCGSLREAFHAYEKDNGELIYTGNNTLMHADDYGVRNLEDMYPYPARLNPQPELINNRVGWVSEVINGVKHFPSSRIRSDFADIRDDEVRARGYLKGKYKKEQVYGLLRRATSPCTIYGKQRMDRDVLLDLADDFDVMAQMKQVVDMKLDEEKALAILIGDGRPYSSEDKIDENCIRPIWTEEDLFCLKRTITHSTSKQTEVEAFIDECVRARVEYDGSGSPTLFCTEEFLVEASLIKDKDGYRLYKTEADIAAACRVSKIVTVQAMKNKKRDVSGVQHDLMGIIVNLNDYTVGSDKKALGFFEDFDLNYNQQVFLKEDRMSGALTRPFSAIVIEAVPAS